MDTTKGYGQAGFQVVTSLQRIGHEVPFDDKDVPVQMCFSPPNWAKYHDGQYRILYTPWESTELPHGWLEVFKSVDEVWATSEWVRSIYEQNGVPAEKLHVYHHGIAPGWDLLEREPQDVVTFLHMGEPALRKGGQMALDAFRAAFGDRDDVRLIVKAYGNNYLRCWRNGELHEPKNIYSNVEIINDLMYPNELLQLYANADVLVYPSYGEGFGLIPLQAMATGLPVISTTDWAPYKEYISVPIGSKMNRSIWSVHPGDVFYPNYDELVDAYHYAYENVDSMQAVMAELQPNLRHDFNWDRLTKKAFEHLENKF